MISSVVAIYFKFAKCFNRGYSSSQHNHLCYCLRMYACNKYLTFVLKTSIASLVQGESIAALFCL